MPPQQPFPGDALASVLERSAGACYGLYLGLGTGPQGQAWPAFVPPQQSMLVLGPPRSGKTSSILIPNVVSACGPVLSISTKRDVLDTTYRARSRVGPVAVFDPTGEVVAPPGVDSVGWSPLAACRTWDRALVVAETMVAASRPHVHGEASHWTERATAALAPLLHAASLDDRPMRHVLSWVDNRQPTEAMEVLAAADNELACSTLSGIVATDQREQSGIWSTAAGVLAAYRSEAALRAASLPPVEPSAFIGEASTLYVCASGRRQQHAGPIIAGLVEEIRAATYERAAATAVEPALRAPVLFAFDELANIAPLKDFDGMLAEGGSQGLVILACLQDLSQARARWGERSAGFMTLFGCKVLLPGIEDVRTLEDFSRLCGESDVMVQSTTDPRRANPFIRPSPPTTTVSTRRQRVMPVDAIAQGRSGYALVMDSTARSGWVSLTPHHASSLWRRATEGGHERGRGVGREHDRGLGR